MGSSTTALAHDVVPPKLAVDVKPEWPKGERPDHDLVIPVQLVVGADGHVETVEVEVGLSPELDEAALRAARAWTFTPATRDGKPVAAKTRGFVRFTARMPPSAGPTTPDGAPSDSAHAATASMTPPVAVAIPQDANAAPPGESVRVLGDGPPRSASQVTRGRDVIAAAPHRTASDVLQVVPGLTVTQHSGEGKAHQIFLRGFDAVHGQDLELWVGGIPVNEVSNLHGQGYADLHFAMPEVIKDVTATPGTYDPRQGDFAVAGTVRMRLGMAEPGITAKGSLGSFGNRRLFLGYHPEGSSDETFGAAEVYETDGFGPNRAAKRASVMGQVSHDFGDGLNLRVLASAFASRFDSAGVVKQSDLDAGRIDRFATYDPKQGGSSTRAQLLLELHKDDTSSRWSVAPFVVFRGLTLRQNFTGFFEDTQRGGGGSIESDNNQQVNDSITLGSTASYRKKFTLFAPSDAFEVGVYTRSDFVEQAQRRLSAVNDVPTSVVVDASVKATNLAGYLDASLHPLPRVTLRGGLRVDSLFFSARDRAPTAKGPVPEQDRAAQGFHLGKKATVDVAVFRGVHALASYGEGFRSPQARSLVEGQTTPFATVQSWEGGLRYAEGGLLDGSVAVFHTNVSDDLAFDPSTTRNEPVPGTERNGVTAELTARPKPWFVVSSNLTYTRASFTESGGEYAAGDLLPYVPQIVARTDAAVERRVAHVLRRDLVLRAGAGTEAIVRRPLPYAEFGRNVFLVDATVGARLKEVELTIDAFNLLDTRWYDGQFVYASNFEKSTRPSLVAQRMVTVGPPRTLMFTLALHI
ncbi:MAG: TonB-dependent receptor [Polyangiaceae bacterium]